jgi:arylsulfatase A-like enzyme
VDDAELEALVFDIAELALERYRPRLLLVHVFNTDTEQHRHGREHRRVAEAFELVDRRLGRLRDKLTELGLDGETLFVVTGDHGFIQTHTRIHLNVALRDSGLVELGDDGTVADWTAMAWPSGGSASIVLKDQESETDARRVEEVLDRLLEGPLGGVVTRVSREELSELGAMPGAVAALEAEEGFIFGKGLTGELLTPSGDLGYHGYLPTKPKMRTGFLMVGPGVRRGVRVPRMRQIDIAPTVALWAGWDLPEADGLALRGLFEAKD